MEKITNIRELRKSLTENYSKMKAKKMPVSLGKELANTAGKVLKSCKVELEYNSMMGVKKEIDFLQ